MTRSIPDLGARRGGGLLPALLLMLAALAAACGGGGASSAPVDRAGEEASGGFPITITDSSDADLLIATEPQRIISYSPAATEILFAIGAGDRLIAADRFSDYPARAEALPKLEYSNPDPEAALAHEPDLLLFATRQREQLQQFRDLGMAVLMIEEAESIEGVYENIRLFGELTGEAQAAEDLVASMRARIEAVTAALADVEQGPRVFYEITPGLFTAAPNTFQGGMLSALKAQNIADGALSQYPQLGAEAVIEADPEVVLLADSEQFGRGSESAEIVAARPGWAGVSAVVNGRVYPINSDFIDRAGPRIAEGIEALARVLYPDRFE